MNHEDNLYLGKVTFTPYTPEERKALLLEQALPQNMVARLRAMHAVMAVVTRLVETATFTLSAEDFSTLEQALHDYENASPILKTP